jgi:hypothetical protein
MSNKKENVERNIQLPKRRTCLWAFSLYLSSPAWLSSHQGVDALTEN